MSATLFAGLCSAADAQPQNPPPAENSRQATSLLTSWGAEVTPEKVHPEYPRPTLVRSEWLNLNGLWDFKSGQKEDKELKKEEFRRKILVPFPPQSALSGVRQPAERCIYRRTLTIPQDWDENCLLILHFGASDWETTVFVNGQSVGEHRGGYDSFSFDITRFIRRKEVNELTVHVSDPAQKGNQPRGRQSSAPAGVWYTDSTGLWQTVWLEPVPPYYIRSLQIHTDTDTGTAVVQVDANASGRELTLSAEAFDGEKSVAKVFGGCDGPMLLRLPQTEVKTWSPDSPHLYQVRVRLLYKDTPIDKIGSYFAFRKIEKTKDENGHPCIRLNGKRLFLMGVIDQGFYPDGLYTAPADGACRMDIRVVKTLGFNAIRKYQKIEPERWYFWCDRLGILVWQDMPAGDNKTPESQRQFRTELQRLIQSRQHHPSIICWTIFNEGAGQHNTEEYIDLVRKLDSSRLVCGASGWADNKGGDVNVSHKFPEPEMPAADADRAAVIGSFGGLTLVPPPEHAWTQNTWGFQHVADSEMLVKRFEAMHGELRKMIQTQNLCGAFFRQLTDTEGECNGLMTYDRKLLKIPPEMFEAMNRAAIKTGGTERDDKVDKVK
ncbi:MAG: hypothetical protein LBH00_09680 [Planctomycetaceae bacterium]|nr:hypothetical protein [Planctomycetaceae bacterium]